MKLKNIVAVSGHPVLMTLVTSRNNGLILKDPTTGKTSFFSVRQHQFTPLETVGIYTMTDTVDLKVIFQTMLDQMAENPPLSPKSPNPDLMKYFATILPDFDRDRVYPGDVKKVIKWFNSLL
ncbi:MAG: hypothetical protein IPN29_13105 [Saprospiraceae bacterium]|nr:hypothetical protein [Saprospiraceae bacterium]